MAKKRRRRTWGTGSITQSGTRWAVRWREKGQRRCKTFATRDLAEAVLAKVTSDIARGEAGMPRDFNDSPTMKVLAKAWLERRERTHRSWVDDVSRWKCHLAPFFANLKPVEINPALIRRFIETKLAKGLSPATVARCLGVLSTFFADVVEQGHAPSNPVTAIPRSTRRLIRSNYDTTATPFLKTTNDIRRVFLALPEPYNVAMAVGALAGLRIGEILGLTWEAIDFEGRRIHVRQQMRDGRLGPLKDDEPRIVPLLTSLAPILTEWRLKTGGVGLLFKPANRAHGGRPDLGSESTYIRPHTLHKHLRKALAACGLPDLKWTWCTRHTFASQFILCGGSIELLSKLLGHSSITTTEIYSHLKPDLFAQKAFDVVTVDLARPAGDVVSISRSERPVGQSVGVVDASEALQKTA